MKYKWLFHAFFLALSAYSIAGTPAVQPYSPPAPPTPPPPAPWLTGPLIAPIGAVIPYGDFEIESYVYFTANTGTYNKHWNSVPSAENFYSLSPQFICFFGITPWCDINIIPQFAYNTISNRQSVQFNDFPVALDFQLLDPAATPYFPGIKFIVKETLPTGNFQRLNPKKLNTDQSGQGTFASEFALVLYKLFHLGDLNWLSMTVTTAYTITSPVRVHGFNAYGGGYGTNGTVLPGNSFQEIVSFEYTFNQNWAFAIDNVYLHTDATQFFGKEGTTSSGTSASVGGPSQEQISFAPAIEYNFSSNFGICAGCWLSAWGRNSTEFRSGVVNIDYTY